MSQGRLQEERRLRIAQAALVWGGLSPNAAVLYVQTGHLELDDSDSDEVMPYDPDVIKQILATGKTGMKVG